MIAATVVIVGPVAMRNAGWGVPLALLILVALVVLVDPLAMRTVFGRHLYAVGGNVEAPC